MHRFSEIAQNCFHLQMASNKKYDSSSNEANNLMGFWTRCAQTILHSNKICHTKGHKDNNWVVYCIIKVATRSFLQSSKAIVQDIWAPRNHYN